MRTHTLQCCFMSRGLIRRGKEVTFRDTQDHSLQDMNTDTHTSALFNGQRIDHDKKRRNIQRQSKEETENVWFCFVFYLFTKRSTCNKAWQLNKIKITNCRMRIQLPCGNDDDVIWLTVMIDSITQIDSMTC